MITLLLAEMRDVPADDGWLLPAERAVLAGLRVEKRRREWRLGRWTAKHAVAAALHLDARDVEIRAAADGAPEARDVAGAPLDVALSLSHREGVAVCAVAAPPQPVGCDVELVEPRPPAFAREWFSVAERAHLDAAAPARRDLLTTVLWSAKESVLKLRRSGLREDPRGVEVRIPTDPPAGTGWNPLHVDGCDAWWSAGSALVVTVAAPALPVPPLTDG